MQFCTDCPDRALCREFGCDLECDDFDADELGLDPEEPYDA